MADTIKLGILISTNGASKTIKGLLEIRDAAKGIEGPIAAASAGMASIGKVSGGVGELAFKFNNVVSAIQILAAAAKPAYDLLIGSNEKLNAQLLSSQSNLAASARIFQGGIEISDPTEKINATKPALQAALKQIEKDTESLVGVTSQQVNELFQITLTNASELNNQSKQFPDPIAAATSLTKGWAASLKVVGVPLDQARQEINSILKGQIDQNSILAKNLGITNQQVQKWQSQGSLVDELNKRLDTFVAGNAIAARSIEGIGSNIQDIFERVARDVGQPLLEPIINALDQFYKFLKQNESAFISFFQGFALTAVNTADQVGQSLEPAIKAIFEVVAEASPVAENLFSLAATGLTATAELLGPLLGVIGEIIAKSVEGIGALTELVQLRQINDASEALAELTSQSQAYYDAALETGAALKALNAAEKQNGSLTEEQIARRKKLTADAKAEIEGIDGKIEALKELNAVGADNRQQRDAEVEALEKTKAALTKQTGEIQIQGKELTRLGDQYEQLQKKAESAQNGINRAQTTEEAAKAAKELIDTTQEQAGKINQISAKAAEERLTKIKNDTRLDVETQQKAAEAITKIYKEKIDRITELEGAGQLSNSDAIGQLEEIKNNSALEVEVRQKASKQILAIRKQQNEAEIAQIQAAQSIVEAERAEGRVGDAAAESALSGLKAQETQKRIEQIQAEADAANDPEVRQKLLAEVSKLQSELTKIEAKERDRRNKERLKDYDEALALAEANFSKGLSSESGYNAQKTAIGVAQTEEEIRQKREALGRLEGADKEGREAINAEIAKAETKRADTVRQGQLKEIELVKKAAADKISTLEDAEIQAQQSIQSLRNADLISQEEADGQLLESSLDRIQKELEAEQEKQAKLAEMAAQVVQEDPKVAEARQSEIRASRRKTAELSSQLQRRQLEEIDRQQSRATALLTQAEAERQGELQRLQNEGLIRTEEVEDLKLNVARARIATELDLEKKRLDDLLNLPPSSNPQQEEQRQQQIRTSKLKTTQLTGQLLENEGQQQENLRRLQLLAIATVSAARQRAAQISEAGYQAEIKLVETANKSLERKGSLLKAQADLQNAQNNLSQTEAGIEIDKLNRAIEIKKSLADGNLSQQERNALLRETAILGVGAETNILSLLQQRQAKENELANLKRQALLASQEQAKSELLLEQQRNDLAAQRAVTEARINELKAKQSVLNAQQQLQEAQTLKPGQERDTAVANAGVAIALAKQQQGFASQSVAEATAQKEAQAKLTALASQTLATQQAAATAQFNAAESARQQGQYLEYARLQAEGLAKALDAGGGRVPAAALPGRKDGGSVEAGQAYLVGETEPEVFVPRVSGTILNQRQIAQNLSALQASQRLAGQSVAKFPVLAPQEKGDRAVVAELQALRGDLEAVRSQSNSFTIVGESDPYSKVMELSSRLRRQQSLFEG